MTDTASVTRTVGCAVCGGIVREFLDLGRQPLSDAFRLPGATDPEFFYRLAVGSCDSCTMVQLMEQVPREKMFHEGYPYFSSGSSVMQEHFASTARRLLAEEATSDDPFVVEIGCNDGVMLRAVRDAGVRHLGVEPSAGVAETAAAKGIDVTVRFFEESTAVDILGTHGPADIVFAANTFCHIPYPGSVLRGVEKLLGRDGVFVFEDPYLGDIVEKTSFDQIYDEHFFLFSAHSVQAMAAIYGLELVDVERLPVHGGEVRYTLARAGRRSPSPAVAELLDAERDGALTKPETLRRFADDVREIRDDLRRVLEDLSASGQRAVAYGATAKSATITNFCGLGPDLVSKVYDSTPAKQGRLTPGTHIPVVPASEFTDAEADVVLLFAWNHAEEIRAKESAFRERGGRWLLYVPDVHLA